MCARACVQGRKCGCNGCRLQNSEKKRFFSLLSCNRSATEAQPDELDGCTSPRARQGDAEVVLQWAVAQLGKRLPWSSVRPQELEFNRGQTARLRRRQPTSWSIAAATAGMIRPVRPIAPRLVKPGQDANLIIATIRQLDPWSSSIVMVCARGERRPDWMEGVEPRLVEKRVYGKNGKGRRRRSGRAQVIQVWEPCSPATVAAVREVYARWHQAVRSIAEALTGRLAEWKITGFAAPERPWETK